MILSGLKTLIETGELLDTPGSLRYAKGLERAVEAEPEPVERAQPEAAPAARGGRRPASRLRVSSIAAQRSGSGGNGNGFERHRRRRVASVWRPASRSSATSAPKRLAPTPSPVWPTV